MNNKDKVRKEFEYAGFWLRFIAYIIDYSILFIIFLIIMIPVFFKGSDMLWVLMLFILLLVLPWLYFALFESLKPQATFGKMIMGIKVTNLKGNRISFFRASFRHFLGFFSSFLCGIGYMLAGWTKQKQALHDELSNCLVIKK